MDTLPLQYKKEMDYLTEWWKITSQAEMAMTVVTVQSQPYLNYHILGNFRIVLFSQISRILLSRKIKFRKTLPCHTFYVAHVDHLRNYWNRHFHENLVMWKFPSIRYLHRSVKSLNYIQHVIIGCNHWIHCQDIISNVNFCIHYVCDYYEC